MREKFILYYILYYKYNTFPQGLFLKGLMVSLTLTNVLDDLMELADNIKEKISSQEYLDLTNFAKALKDLEDETLYLTILYPVIIKKPKNGLLIYMEKTTLLLHKLDFDLSLFEDLKEKLNERYGLFPIKVSEFKFLLPEYYCNHLMSILPDDNGTISDDTILQCLVTRNY